MSDLRVGWIGLGAMGWGGDDTSSLLRVLSGAGHVWPGGRPDYLPRLLGPGTDVIDANEEAWKFFRRFVLPPART